MDLGVHHVDGAEHRDLLAEALVESRHSRTVGRGHAVGALPQGHDLTPRRPPRWPCGGRGGQLGLEEPRPGNLGVTRSEAALEAAQQPVADLAQLGVIQAVGVLLEVRGIRSTRGWPQGGLSVTVLARATWPLQRAGTRTLAVLVLRGVQQRQVAGAAQSGRDREPDLGRGSVHPGRGREVLVGVLLQVVVQLEEVLARSVVLALACSARVSSVIFPTRVYLGSQPVSARYWTRARVSSVMYAPGRPTYSRASAWALVASSGRLNSARVRRSTSAVF